MPPILTPNFSAPSLCKSCRNAVNLQGQRLDDSGTYCRKIEKMLHFVIVDCSEYEDKSTPTLYDMDKIAWKISSDRRSKQAGFLSPSEFRTAKKDDKATMTPHDEEFDF